MSDRSRELDSEMRSLTDEVRGLATQHYAYSKASDDASPISRKLKSEISEITGAYVDSFEEQRKNIGKCYALGNNIRELSKIGISFLKRNESENVSKVQALIKKAWTLLGEFNIPQDMAWTFDNENGQEMVEFEVSVVLYNCLYTDIDPETIHLPSEQELNVRPQTWLAGIGDAVTEVGKVHLERLCVDGIPKSQRIAARKKYIDMACSLREGLDRFETAYGQVVNNSRRKGFANTYRGLLMRIDRMIIREQEALAAIYDTL